MTRKTLLRCALAFVAAAIPELSRADIVQDWNDTLCIASQTVVSKHNPGVPTRAMAMMNGAIYDVFQSFDRTHKPFKVNVSAAVVAPGASLEAAVSQAAWRVLDDMYPEIAPQLADVRDQRMLGIPDAAKAAGVALGNLVAQQYINSHQNDGWDLPDNYNAPGGVGHWTSDPLVPVEQKGWGSDWGSVTPWAIPSPDHFDAVTPFAIADLNTPQYTAAFNEVKAYGARNSAVRSEVQTQTGLFWAYDRPGTGAPPVLFIENMRDIGNAVGNAPADNARMFAQASIALADAIIAAWKTKYDVDLWRPITGIRLAHLDGNADTEADPFWEYLGAPGDDPNGTADDFTPPFPAYISGHATMGGAIFKTLELFYGTNDFAAADASIGNDLAEAMYTLYSSEPGSGPPRQYVRFTQEGPLARGWRTLRKARTA